MISGLLSFLGLGFGVLDNPQAVADRNSHFQSLVAQVEKVSTEHTHKAFEFPFHIEATLMALGPDRPSPIYSMFRNGRCTIVLNTNPSTHRSYGLLIQKTQEDKPMLKEEAELYVVGHEIGHCVYKHLLKTDPKQVNFRFERHREDADLAAEDQVPEWVTPEQQHLHQEIFADMYGIQFAKKWLNQDSLPIEHLVVEFRKKVSDHDPSYYTQHFLRPNPGEHHDLEEHLHQ